jgi:tetratricopeptide (TPR) repeat protein
MSRPGKRPRIESHSLGGGKTIDPAGSMLLVQIIVVFLIAFGVYLNTLSNGFVYDDDAQVVENIWIKSIKYIPRIFLTDVWKFSGDATSSYYRPMMHVVYLMNYKIFGLSPWGFHLVNIILHAGVSVLVLFVARRLICAVRPADSFGFLTMPFLAGLLFAVHPIHTEVVAWVAGVPELLFTLFTLLSLYLYIQAGEGKHPHHRSISYSLSVVSFALAIFSKETAIVLPLFLVIYDYAFKDGQDRLIASMKRCVPYVTVAAICLIMRLIALGGFAPLRRHSDLSSYECLINVFPLFARYLGKILLPVNLNAFYVFHPIRSITELEGILSLAVTSLFLLLLILSFRRNRVAFFGLVVTAAPLIPVLYIRGVGINVFAERYLYLPSVGFAILLSLLIQWASGRFPKWRMPVVILLLAGAGGFFSVGTIDRNRIWKDNFVLWTDTLKKSPDGAIPHASMGDALLALGRVDEAIREYDRALALSPDYYGAIVNLGVAYLDKGLVDRAIEQARSALNSKPNSYGAHVNLGLAYMRKGRIDEAIEEFRAAIRLNPDSAGSYNNLGLAYGSQGRLAYAIRCYEKAVSLNPDYAEAYNNLGIAYAENGSLAAAIRQFETAAKLNPQDKDYQTNLNRARNLRKKN